MTLNRSVFCLCFLAAWLAAPLVVAGQCVRITDDEAEPAVKVPEVDVRQIIRITATAKSAAAKKNLNYLYVAVARRTEPGLADTRLLDAETKTFVRMLTGLDPSVPFTFSREGKHYVSVYGADESSWPQPVGVSRMTRVCGPQEVPVYPPVRREDFPGVRGQWWGAYRLPVRAELGGAVFVRRLGFAATAAVDVVRAVRNRSDPADTNPVIGVFELRYRGARGHIGGGLRYYPDDEPDREHWRPTVSFADELPSFKGRPIWLLFDIWLDERRRNFLKGLDFSFGARFDLWGSKP